jgi:CRP/FNR family cyclic AMP-dependent transcriptional regulator
MFSTNINSVQHFLEVSNSDESLASFINNVTGTIYKKKQVIYTVGHHPFPLYYIIKGKVKAYKTTETGKDLTIGLYGAGDFLGYIPLLQGTVYTDTAEAIEDSEVAIIPREYFEVLLNHNFEIARKFISILANNVIEKESQLLGIAYNSVRKKVAEALIALKNKFKKPGEENFCIDISRDNLASIAGVATESLIRTLSDFKAERLIDIHNGSVILLSEKKLENLYN